VRSFLILTLAIALSTAAATRSGVVDVPGTVSVGGQATADAAVWLEGHALPRRPPAGKVVLDQRNLSFSPRVLVVQVGTTVELPNNDRVFHNVFSFRDGKRFDLGLYPVGTVRHVTFDHVGLSRIFCNIHPNMAAYVLAVDSPYFDVSDDHGRFTITGVTTGAYTYHAWRAGEDELTGRATVGGETPLDIQWP
jgi:plastocyanin